MTNEEIKQKTAELFNQLVSASTEEERLALKEQIFQLNIKLAWDVACKMKAFHVLFSEEDVFQNACLKLYEAIDKFDPTRGYAFSNYALVSMRNDFKVNFIHRSRCGYECHRLRKKLNDENCDNPEKYQQELELYSRFLESHIASLDEPAYNSQNDENIMLMATIADGAPLVDENAVTQEGKEVVRSIFDPNTSILREREKFFIYQYYYNNKTFSEIGEMFGVSRQYVEQVLKKALRKIKPILEQYFYPEEESQSDDNIEAKSDDK